MKKNSFLKNVLILLFSQGIIKVVGIIYKLYLTNKTGYGDVGNALFAAAFQVYAIFLTICSIGVPNAISNLISSKVAMGDNRGAYRILKVAIAIFGSIGFSLSIVLYFLAKTISVYYLEMPETENVLKSLAPSIFIVAVTAVFKGYFNGKQKMDITANSLSIEQIIKTIITIVVVEVLASISGSKTYIMVWSVGITTTIGNSVSLIYIYINYLKSKREIWTDIITSTTNKLERKRTILKSIFKVSCPIAFCALIATFNKTIDALTIVRITKVYLGETEAIRQYGILSGKVESLVTFPLSFNMAITTVLIPKISEFRAKGEIEKTKEMIKNILCASIIIGIPCFLSIFCFSKDILKILFPRAYDGYLLLKYSSITILITIMTQTINSYLQGMNKMGIQLIAVGIGTIMKVVLNILLLQNSKLGIYGAVISNIISYSIVLFVLIYYLIMKEKIHFEIRRFLIKPVILGLNMYIILKKIYMIHIMKNDIFNLLFCLTASGIIYIIMIFFSKILQKSGTKC